MTERDDLDRIIRLGQTVAEIRERVTTLETTGEKRI